MFRIYSGLVMGGFGLCLAAIVGGMGIGAARQEAGMPVYGDSLILLDTALPGAPPFHPSIRYPTLPVWSPYGQQTAVSTLSGGQSALYLIEVATGKMTALYRAPSNSSLRFQWQPHSRNPA